jgi:hypothetical protein
MNYDSQQVIDYTGIEDGDAVRRAVTDLFIKENEEVKEFVSANFDSTGLRFTKNGFDYLVMHFIGPIAAAEKLDIEGATFRIHFIEYNNATRALNKALRSMLAT